MLTMKRARAFAVCAAALILSAVAAGAGTARADDRLGGWEPSISIGTGVMNQETDGFVSSDLGPLGTTVSRSDDFRSILLRLDGTLHSPPLVENDQWKPRLFLRMGLERALREKVNAFASFVGIDTAGVAANCVPGSPGGALPDTARCQIESAVRLTSTAAWFVGLGVDVSRELFDLPFRVNASLDYFGQTFKADGFYRVIEREGTFTAPETVTSISAYSDRIYLHGIGPQVRVHAEVYDWGPLNFDLYIGGQVYWILNDTDEQFSGALGTNTANFGFELEDFVARGIMGIQVNWRGETR